MRGEREEEEGSKTRKRWSGDKYQGGELEAKMMGSKKEAEMKGGKNKRKMELSRQEEKEKEIKAWKVGGGVYRICVLAVLANLPYQPINI